MERPSNVVTTLIVGVLAWGFGTAAVVGPRRPNPGARAEAVLADPLDGATFVGDSGPKGQPADEHGDELSFTGGRFRSKACDRYGFGDAPYKVAKSAGEVGFSAVTHSAKEGEMSWKGTLRGTTLEGSVVWTKAGQPAYEYWFKAQRR